MDDHCRSMKFYSTSYLSVLTSNSLNPIIFYLFSAKPLNHWFFFDTKSKNVLFLYILSLYLVPRDCMRFSSSIISYFFLISFSCSISPFSPS